MRFTNSKVLSCLVFSCLYAGSALATDTRVGVLRYNGGIDDETLVFTYPGQISKYNVALFELGTYDDKNAYGAAFANTGSFHIGAALSRTDWLFTNGALSYNANSGNISTVSLLDKYETDMLKATDPELSVPARPIELLAGFDIGAGTLGLRLSMASYRNKESADAAGVATNVEKTAQQTELALGFHTGAAGSLDVA